MNHKQAIADKVNALFNIDSPDDNSILDEIHRSASISANNILDANYNNYVAIFSALSDSEYEAIVAKEYYEQTDEERILMACENAEANLYMYHLLSKLEFISEDDLRYRKQTFGAGSIEPERFLDMIEGRYSYYKDAKKIFGSIDWTGLGVGGSSGFYIKASKSYVEATEEEEGI